MSVAQDIRLDRIGFVAELIEHYQKPLITAVKSGMTAGDRAEGQLFGGLLAASTTTDVDAEKFVRLWEAGKITRAQFVAAVKVSATAARETLSAQDFARIATVKPGAPSLRVTRLKGVEVALVDAVKEVAAEIAAGRK